MYNKNKKTTAASSNWNSAIQSFFESDYNALCAIPRVYIGEENIYLYWVTQKLPQIYTANYANFPIRIRKIKVQNFVKFWVTQYL